MASLFLPTWTAKRLLRLLILAGALVAVRTAAHEEGFFCRYQGRDAARDGAVDPPPNDSVGERRYAPDRAVDVLHVKADVTPDFAKQSIAGTVRIEFKPIAKPLDELKLDGVNLEVTAVRSSHKVRDFTAGEESISVVFAEPIPADATAWVEVDYSAEPQMGLYFRTAAMGLPAGEDHCFTQGEPEEARHWLPCFDWPNERSTSELVCHVPAAMTVISNGKFIAEARVDDADGKGRSETPLKAVHWRQDKSQPSYLFCFVAGKFEKLENRHGDTPLGFYVQPSKAKYAAIMFDGTADMVDFYESEIGVPYPWDKYDQATIADFMWGGMENTTITTESQRALAEPASENIREARELVAHELAHQWFGDYVTCKDWSQIWLNEGFATYYAHLYDGHKFGRDALLYGLYRDARDEIFPEMKDKRPIAYRRYKHPEEQFDFRAYPKGSWVLHMLRSQLGEETYRRAIKQYLQRHALGDVESDDLREAFEEVSGRTLDKFFDQWVYHGGLPELTVKYEWLARERQAHVTIDQTQTIDDQVLLFDVSTKLRFIVDGKTTDEAIRIDGKHHDFYVRLAKAPSIVRFDPDYSVLAKVTFDASEAMLVAQLAQEADPIGRVLACEGLAKRSTTRAVETLRSALNGDKFFGVREVAAEALGKIGSEKAASALGESLEQSDARVRLAAVQALGKCYSQAARQKLAEVYREEKNPAVAAAAVAGLAKVVDAESIQALRDALATTSLRNERAVAAMVAIGEFHRTDLADDLRKTLAARVLEIDTRDYEDGLISLAQASQRGRRRDAAFAFFADLANDPRDQIRLGSIRALGELHDQRARALLEPLAAGRGNENLSRAAATSLAALDSRTPEAPAELSALRREVRELRDKQGTFAKSLDALKAKSAAAKDSPASDDSSDSSKK